jgi:hypothetical protein
LLEVESDHPLNVGGELHPAGATLGAALFERYSVDSYLAESRQRWQRFVGLAKKEQATSVVESYPYQNGARVLLQMDTSTDQITRHVADVENMVQPLAPALIYLDWRTAGRPSRPPASSAARHGRATRFS